jgi:predicted TPR repeat methyltransferase
MDDAVFERGKALFFAGLDHFKAGRFADAAAAFEASLTFVPDRVSTLANLGAARVEAGRHASALEALERAIAAEPDDLDSRSYLGVALAALGRYDEALAAQDAVLAQAPDRAANWFRRGQVLQGLERHEEALVAYERALVLQPTLAPAWTQKGGLLRDAGRLDDAARAYEQALAHGADAGLNGYYLAAVTGRQVPPVAPIDYVAPFFDEYAQTFDRHLVGTLHYRAPERLAADLAACGPPGFRQALDIGCGTGLLGALLRTVTARLDGIDLSQRMLECARARGVYDALFQVDAATHLHQTDARYDLVVAADVFIYVGDLERVFDGVARVLLPQGLFAFTAEAAPGDAAGYMLQANLRYAHARGYLETLAARHGFEVRLLQRAPLREEQQRAVEGWYVVLRR